MILPMYDSESGNCAVEVRRNPDKYFYHIPCGDTIINCFIRLPLYLLVPYLAYQARLHIIQIYTNN